MRLFLMALFLTASGFIFSSLTHHPVPALSPGLTNAVEYFRTERPGFSASCDSLRSAIASIDPSDSNTIADARRKLAGCREHYKRIEFFLDYFFRSSARIYNSAPKFEAEEPSMEYQAPIGLQVIESGLFERMTPGLKQDLLQQAAAVAGSAADLSALLYDFKATDAQLLESIRLDLIRIISLAITGFDAPLLKTGIAESYQSLVSIRHQLQPYLTPGNKRSDSLTIFLNHAIIFLHDHPDFDSFDRLGFLTGHALPLQRQLKLLLQERDLVLNTTIALDYNADHLFSRDALIPENFPGGRTGNQRQLATIGETLFSDPTLSGNGKRSCASCHNPDKAFTDQLKAPLTFDGHGTLDRNAPSLLYSGLQYQQFWDGKAASLEEQIRTVLLDPREMNADTTQTTARLDSIATAIAAYVRSLHPMSSAFDRYIAGNHSTLDASEKRGANLFMGRAQCATCHFAPLFNGLIPPLYRQTEFEVLGTTATDNLDSPRLSPDQGKYTRYAFDFYKGAFKTPTVRNVAVTGPYMHNGAFTTLDKVMDFYNKGGGAGLGLDIPSQSLPSTPLNLTPADIKDIIHFLYALTDSIPDNPARKPSHNLPVTFNH